MEKILAKLKADARDIRQRLDEENNPDNYMEGQKHRDVTTIHFYEGYVEALEETIEMIEDEIKNAKLWTEK